MPHLHLAVLADGLLASFRPHNLHLQAGMSNGWGVEFHYHNWMLYQAVFEHVPAPQNGWVTPPDAPGFDLDPKPEVVQEYRQRSE
jgi:L-alanine-DL-glutamate epimerase-like enolase superfamily enzyme